MENNNGNGNLQGKTVLLVNTGSLKKKFIVQRLKKLGLNIIALNKEKNWAQPYVDRWIIADTYNHLEAILEVKNFLKYNPKVKIDGVITFWEDDVLLVSKLIDKFNFTGIPFNIAKKVRNKFLFRQFCLENGIKTPGFKMVRSKEDINYICRHFDFPLVIKPAYGASSAYVVKVENKEELMNTYNYIKKNISTELESALSDGLEIFVEEYLDGDEVDIDILLQNGKVKFYSIADNYNKNREEFFVDSGQAIPSGLPEKNQDELIEMATETLEKLGIQNGCIHFEAKSTKNGPFPIEVNMRMGGDYVYSYIKGAWDVDFIEYAVKIAIGQYFKIDKPATPKKYIVGWDLHPESSGILVELEIKEELEKKKYLEEIHMYKEIGDPVLLPPEGYESLGWLTISGDNILDAQDNLKEALSFINYKVVEFNEGSSLGKTSRKNRFSSAVLNKNLLMHAAKIRKMKVAYSDHKKLHIGILGNTNDFNNNFPGPVSAGKHVEKILRERGYRVTFFDVGNLAEVFYDLRKMDIDLVFNACDSVFDYGLNTSRAANLLEVLQIPYTGSDALTLALCQDKIMVKKLLTYNNIPTAKWDFAYTMDDKISEELRYPLIVKPGNTDHSIGINNQSVVTNKKELDKQLKRIIVDLGYSALVEEYIDGDEYDVVILGSKKDNFQALPLSKTDFKKLPKGYWHIYSYEAKWFKNPPYNKITVQRPPKNISKKLEALLTEIALDTYRILHCHDYGRVEIRVDKNDNPYVLELNPNPPLDPKSQVSKAAKLVDMNYGDLLEELINLAIKRYQEEK